MNHTQFIASQTPARKQALHVKSTAKGLRHLAGHLSALALMGFYIAQQLPLWPLMLLPYGIAMVFLFTLSHECTHATPFAHKRLNEAVGHAVSLPLILPFTWFRYFHLAHHKHTNDPNHDPELEGHGKPNTWPGYLVTLSGWGYWRYGIVTLLTHATGRVTARYLPPRKHTLIIREARILLCFYALILISLVFSPLALWLWIVPALLGQPFLRLYLLAEHGHCPPVADMLENTRTTRTNRLVCALAWNMPYHAEHHAMPQVPFYHLPDLHNEIAPHLKSVSDGYIEFTKDYAATLK